MHLIETNLRERAHEIHKQNEEKRVTKRKKERRKERSKEKRKKE